MRMSSVPIRRGLLVACLALLGASGARAAGHLYIPFTEQLNGTGRDQGAWLADTANLGNPPFQLTNQVLDGPAGANVAILDDWSLNAITHEATNVKPQLVVYGVGGNLFMADLHTISPVSQFSNGSYAELCSLTALDERPFMAAKAYIQAVVEPMGSVNTCASGVGTQTWLIPANATAATAPTIEPAHWAVIGAFTSPVDGSFVRWVVWTGNQVVAYKANFTGGTTLLVGPPAGPAPTVSGRVDGDMFLLSGSEGGGTHTDALYRVAMAGSGLVATYSYPDAAVCGVGDTTTGIITSSIADAGAGILIFTEPTATGYAAYTVPLASGSPTQIYADNSGNECGAIAGDAPSVGRVGLDEVDMTSLFQHVISINEAGPVSQSPVLLSGGAMVFSFLHYTIDGHFWVDVDNANTTPDTFSELVIDGDGTVIQDYPNARNGNDIWGGYFANGATPGIERDVVYLFTPNLTPCTGGTLAAIDPGTFASTAISGVPADACRSLAYGWQPASVGYVREGTGSRPVEIDPVGGRMYSLLGPDANGLFLNLALLPGYPFY